MKYIMDHRFESFQDFLEQAKKPGHPGNPLDSVNTQGGPEWYGTASYEEAIRFAENGWPAGLERMQSVRGAVNLPTPVMAEVLTGCYAEAGDEPDVARHLAHEPESMIEFRPQFVPATGRVVKLLLNPFSSAGISAHSMFMRGAAATVLADAIETSGLRAEIELHYLCKHLAGGGQDCSRVIVTLKRPDQPLELDRMAFMLANASVCRRFIFRLMEFQPPQLFRTHFASGGSPRDLDTIPEDTVYFGQLSYNQLQTDAQCHDFINRTLAKYVEA